MATIAGASGVVGTADGAPSSARFNGPDGLALAGTTLYVVDTGNNAVRRLTTDGTGPVVTLQLSGDTLKQPRGPLTIDMTGNLFLTDGASRIFT